jgi:ribosomal protein S18 acetylase RimI-like enzyme
MHKPKRIVLRDYRPADDDDLNALQHASSMEHAFGAWLHSYLRVAIEDKGGYDARARDFDDFEVIVAEAENGAPPADGQACPRIVGVINVGIKPVNLAGSESRVGFLYGLRVHEAVQSSGTCAPCACASHSGS